MMILIKCFQVHNERKHHTKDFLYQNQCKKDNSQREIKILNLFCGYNCPTMVFINHSNLKITQCHYTLSDFPYIVPLYELKIYYVA